MAESLVLLGAFCVIAAVVGGGLTLSHVGTMPVVNSLARQLVLALCGAALIGGGIALRGGDEPPSSASGNAGAKVTLPKIDFGDGDREQEALEVSPRRVRPGTLLKLNGRGFQPGESVDIAFSTETLGTATANTDGRFFNKRVRFPSDWGFTGREDIRASGQQSLVTPRVQIEILCRAGYKRVLSSCVAPGSPGYDGP
ncbi:MAG: hypothetical protein QOE31_3285 [Solirubrobacteraceae bacterium]|jgi:hypothetical protein|nr:hypothetical protein [Solirubrobacteraceae bacterium]